METFGPGTLARRGKQTDICVCSHPRGGEMPLRRTRTFDSERQEVHTVLGNDDVDGAVDLEQKSQMEMFPTYHRNRDSLSPP